MRTFAWLTTTAVATVACGGEATPPPNVPTTVTPAASSTTPSSPPPTKPSTMGDISELAPLLPLWALFGTGGNYPSPDAPVQGWHRHDATGTCMPDGVGSFVVKNHVDASHDDRGVSLLSREDATVLSFFTYPAPHSLEKEIGSVVAGMCKGAAGAMQMPVADARFPERGIVAACAHVTDLGPSIEQALVFRRGDWFFEARFTFLQGNINAQYGHAMAAAQTAFRPCAP